MTDNDIIEGLRCCNNGLCEICPYHEEEFLADCREQNGNDALDLINRQKAEIERLKRILGGTSKVLSETCAGVRVEAIREFAEMLKKNAWKRSEYVDGRFVFREYTAEEIDHLAKEMTENKR